MDDAELETGVEVVEPVTRIMPPEVPPGPAAGALLLELAERHVAALQPSPTADLDPALIVTGRLPAHVAYDACVLGRDPALAAQLATAFDLLAGPAGLLAGPLQAGDVLLRRALGEGPFGHVAVLLDGELLDQAALLGRGWLAEPGSAGLYARTIDGGRRSPGAAAVTVRRIADVGGRLPCDQLLLRPRAVAEVQAAETAGPQAATSRTSPAFIRWVQISLNRLIGAALAEDGVMGARTRAAIRSFQSRHGLTPDGIVGARTEATLRTALGEQQAPAPAVPCPPAGPVPASCQGLRRREVIDCFAFAGHQVLPRHEPQIANIAHCILASQSTATPIDRVTLIGHTDPVGSEPDNDRLGVQRAEAVRDAIRARLGPRPPAVTFDVRSRGERDQVPGDPALSRRVALELPFDFPAPRPPVAAATIEIVQDDDDDRIVDGRAPVATFTRFGLWDRAYDAAGDIRNGQAEADNFVGSDRRRFYLRVRDPSASTTRVQATWRTLRADGRTDDDAPASQEITLLETAAGSRIFVSRAIMLVTDDTDARQPTHSGLNPPLADARVRNRGESNHRLRRAGMDGFVRAEYRPASGATATVTLPVFQRNPEERRRLRVRVVNYITAPTPAGLALAAARIPHIIGQFVHANLRWNQIGLRIVQESIVNRPVPAGMLDGAGEYPGEINNAEEAAALRDLRTVTPDNTLTVVFVPLAASPTTGVGRNAYATVGERTTVAIGNRYFIFVDDLVDLTNETLAHELSHVLFNRFDGATERRFFTLNTNAPDTLVVGTGITLPDVRIYRRIQTLHAPNPDNDAAGDNVVNWARRRRVGRFPPAAGMAAPTATTGNTLTESV